MTELFCRCIDLMGALHREQVQRWGETARRCPVHRTLSRNIRAIDEVEAVPG